MHLEPRTWQSTLRSSLLYGAILLLSGASSWALTAHYLSPTTSKSAEETTQALTPNAHAAALSTTTPLGTIRRLTIADVVPAQGKLIAADLVHMELYLYQDGTTTAEYPILTKGRPGTPYETPSGYYTVLSKEVNHVNAWENVSMPYSMQFNGNYFIHGWPTYADDTPVASTYSGGCIRLSTADAVKVYAFADTGTGVFVYDPGAAASIPSVTMTSSVVPPVSAAAYLVADLDTEDVYAERNGTAMRPIASVTKLMTALTANETIMFDHPITVPKGDLSDATSTDATPETFVVGNLLYPLLMESNNKIAADLARYYGTNAFVGWMNAQAKSLGMASTSFADASGISPEDQSTAEDLFRLADYLANKKSFIWDITRTPTKTITASNSTQYVYQNFNLYSGLDSFIGGKVGKTTAAKETMVSVFTVPVGNQMRRIAIIVLGSDDYNADTSALLQWFSTHASLYPNTACASCAGVSEKKIPL